MVQDESESRIERFRQQKKAVLADFTAREERGLSYLEMNTLFFFSAFPEIKAGLQRIKVRDAVALYDQMIQLNLGMLKRGK